MRVKASSVVLAHNHIDKDVSSSNADIALACMMVNLLHSEICIVDHIIFVKEEKTYGFHRSDLLDILQREQKAYSLSRGWEDMLS